MNLYRSLFGRWRRIVCLLVGCILLATTLQLNARELEEVIVTATKREGTIQSMSAVVSAMTSEQMAMRGVATAQDMAFSVPGLVYGEATGSPQITIRGIGLSVETGAAEMGVASYVNGVFLSRPGLTNLALGDLERIEVLRGPQGTLYGRNATGGAVNFISKRPTIEADFTVTLGRSSFNSEKAEVAMSTPMSDSGFGARLFVKYETTDGYIENLSSLGGFRDPGQADDVGIRLSLLANPFNTAEVDLTLGFVEKEGAVNNFQVIDFVGEPVELPTGKAFTLQPNKAYHNVKNEKNIDGKLGALSITKDFEWLSIKSITGYTKHTRDEYFDADGRDPIVGLDFSDLLPDSLGLLPNGVYVDTDVAVDRADDYSTFTQEFNLTAKIWRRLDYILGFFYMDENGEFQLHTEFGPSTPLAEMPLVGSNLEEKNESMAIFTDVTIELRDDLRLLAGARWGRDTKSAIQTDYSATASILNGYELDGTCTKNPKLEYKNVSPKAGVEYDVNDSVLLYLTYQEATKPGGYNVTVCGDEFFEEEVRAYEAGVKSTFFNGQLVVNATAFTYDYTDYQIFQLRPPATAEVLNAPEAHINGAELEFRGSYGPYFDVDFGYSYLDAQYDTFVGVDGVYLIGGPGPQDLSGNQLTRAPDWSANLGLELTFPLDWLGLGHIKLRAETSHKDDMYFRQFNTKNDLQEAYTISNVFLAVSSKERRITLRAFVKNLENTEYVVSQLSNALELFAVTPDSQGRQATFLGFYGPPRSSGVELTVKF